MGAIEGQFVAGVIGAMTWFAEMIPRKAVVGARGVRSSGCVASVQSGELERQ